MNHARVEPCYTCGRPTLVVVDEEGTPTYTPILFDDREELINQVLLSAAAYVEATEARRIGEGFDTYSALAKAVQALAEWP